MKFINPHIVFDFDGVLCDSQDLSIESYSYIREKHFSHLPAVNTKEDHARLFAGDPDSCLYKWLTPNETTFFYEEQTRFIFENSDRVQLFDGISDILKGIPGSQLSILTTNTRRSVEKILNRELGSSFLFDDLIFAKDLGLPKSAMFHLLFETRQVNPVNTFYVCDSEADIQVCNAIKLNSIAVGYGYFPIRLLAKLNPTMQISDVNELSIIINKILKNDFTN